MPRDADGKYRQRFRVDYRDGHTAHGTLYFEGNVQMDSGLLVSRLDQLVYGTVKSIYFYKEGEDEKR